jgi:4-diphosphocytidyl-2-C-methyl-D-erythritol kinase
LRGLDRVLPGALPAHRLAEIALRLGADVPFFLDPQPARVRGVGERVEPLAGLPALPVLLAHPGISVATAEVYADWDRCEGALTPSEPRPTMAAVFGPGLGSTALSRLVADGFPEGGFLHNDLEGPAVRLCPAIADLRRRIEKLGADAAGMSGSGATVFGLFRELTAARAALSRGGFGESIGDANWARVSATRPSL